MPMALENKRPSAGKSCGWQHVLPSRNLSPDPRSGVARRRHTGKMAIQRLMKKAVATAGITKPATPHTLRHSCATMFHPHALNKGGRGLGRLQPGG